MSHFFFFFFANDHICSKGCRCKLSVQLWCVIGETLECLLNFPYCETVLWYENVGEPGAATRLVRCEATTKVKWFVMGGKKSTAIFTAELTCLQIWLRRLEKHKWLVLRVGLVTPGAICVAKPCACVCGCASVWVQHIHICTQPQCSKSACV